MAKDLPKGRAQGNREPKGQQAEPHEANRSGSFPAFRPVAGRPIELDIALALLHRHPRVGRILVEAVWVHEAGGDEAFEAWLDRAEPITERERAVSRTSYAREVAYGNVLDYILAYPWTDTYFASLRAKGCRVPSEDEIEHVRTLLGTCNLTLGGCEAFRSQNRKAHELLDGIDSLTNKIVNLVASFEAAIGHAPSRGDKPPAPELVFDDICYLGVDDSEVVTFLMYLRSCDPAFSAANPERLRAAALGELRQAKPASAVRKGGSGNSGAVHAIAELGVQFRAFGWGTEGKEPEKAIADAKALIRRFVKSKKQEQGV